MATGDPVPGLSSGAASDKGDSGLYGRTGNAPGLSGDLEPGVRLRAMPGGQTSPAPAALKAGRTPQAPASCPRCRRARVSARRAASRPGFEESGGQRGVGSAWAGLLGSSGGSAPRCTARPKDVCAPWSRDPGGPSGCLGTSLLREIGPFLKQTTKKVSRCKCVVGQPFFPADSLFS